jgi:uncharacterized protein YjbI with pentapeptide repeats
MGRDCLAHCGDEERRIALKQFGEVGKIDARGVIFDSALLGDVLAAAPRIEGRPVIRLAKFDHATFEDARFPEMTFAGEARFRAARFLGEAWFDGATFEGICWFGGAVFSGVVWFGNMVFGDVAGFHGTRFRDDVGFDGATFTHDVDFRRAMFTRCARFADVTFKGDVRLSGAVFRDSTTFIGARFEQASHLGPLVAYRDLTLDGAEFAQRVRIEASAAVLSCRRARFSGGVQFRLRWAHVVLDESDLSEPSTLGRASSLADAQLTKHEQRAVEVWRRFADVPRPDGLDSVVPEVTRRMLESRTCVRPQLLSLQGANVAGLALNGVALNQCQFAGVHNLDKLHLEADVSLATVSAGIGRFRFRWDRRQVIAEESAWRSGQPLWWPAWLGDPPRVLDPGHITSLYRLLRKGREDNKDEPGAADFYYGEMEMRRRAGRTADDSVIGSRGLPERALLTVYWLVSGYGLRAWRALAWLTVTMVMFAVLFHVYGVRASVRPDSYWESLLYTFETALSLQDKDSVLTGWGRLFRGLLRITSPALFGLAMLALRGRVKR